ncbi:MAG: Holliday junction resolvase RuvX [Planctomycetota bacterium]|nr:MAG: Holliday junction resolvase RuvX [Planctomycetota bacterium]
MNPKRILALDYGHRRVGLAISDPLCITTTPLKTLLFPRPIRTQQERTIFLLHHIQNLLRDYNVSTIVLGMPKNMSGTLSQMAKEVQKVQQSLQKHFPNIQIILWDERLSTLQAERELKRLQFSFKKRQQKIDAMAAQLILQNFLDANSLHKKKNE